MTELGIQGALGPLGGVKIIEDRNMHDKVPDWSRCRSPSRSKRRHRQGHKTRMFLREVPWTRCYQLPGGAIAMHPTIADELRRKLRDQGSGK